MASVCSSPSRFSQPDVDDHDGPDHGDVLLERIRDYDKDAVAPLTTFTREWNRNRRFNAATPLITEVYPQWYRNLEEIVKYRSGEYGNQFWNRNPDKLFDFAVSCMIYMPQALQRAKGSRPEEKRAYMPVFLRTMEQLSRAPWIRYRGNDHLLRHLDDMAKFRFRHFPPNWAAFDNGELTGNPDFERVFAAFDRLVANGQPTSAEQGRGLVHSSVTLVLDAARALLIKLDDINITLDRLVDEATRPTCITRPVTDPLFFSGTKEQPGAVALKSYLGSPQKDSDSQFPLDVDGASTYLGEKRHYDEFSKFGPYPISKPPADAGENIAKRQALEVKKGEPASSGPVQKPNSQSSKPTGKSSSGPATKQKAKSSKPTKNNNSKSSNSAAKDDGHYRYTLEDAEADIESLQAAVGGWAPPKGLVHPVCGMPTDILARYYDTVKPWFDEWAWARKADGHDLVPGLSSKVLAQLEREIEKQRDYLAVMRKADRYNYGKLKGMKCASLLLCYLRSVHMRYLMLARPDNDLLQARADRLAYWILHEQVWNDATLYSLRMTKATSKLRPQLRSDRKAREAHIADWQEQLLALEQDIAQDPVDKPVGEMTAAELDEEMEGIAVVEEEVFGGAEGDEEVAPVVDEENGGAVHEKEEEATAAAAAEAAAKEGNTAPPPVFDQPRGKYYGKEVEDLEYCAYPGEPQLVLDPVRYGRRMRRLYVSGEAQARYEWHWVTREDGEKELVKGEKKKRAPKPAKFTVFEAGGPEGHKDLPRETVYDRLQYMIIMTFWRVLQAQLHDL
ncbi:hypothetical protein PG991_015301 [Apiospora marii]|uniref:Uncharacterized protein n=1 Tax=Apiospora marii TaxID=335849 RepID=A0ABR1R195_9PEZI